MRESGEWCAENDMVAEKQGGETLGIFPSDVAEIH